MALPQVDLEREPPEPVDGHDVAWPAEVDRGLAVAALVCVWRRDQAGRRLEERRRRPRREERVFENVGGAPVAAVARTSAATPATTPPKSFTMPPPFEDRDGYPSVLQARAERDVIRRGTNPPPLSP